MEISKEVLEQALTMLENQLSQYRPAISNAFSENEEVIDIGSKIRFSYVKGKFKIQSNIAFIESKIKDSVVKWYDPDQMQLFDDEPEDPEKVDI